MVEIYKRFFYNNIPTIFVSRLYGEMVIVETSYHGVSRI